ncbi:MAG: polysaccharide deacetylase family protein [Flavobacteriales bacterium]
MTWKGPERGMDGRPRVYLTFDDGPHPEITREVMEILSSFGALATFFCVGSNVTKHPDVVNELQKAGHGVENHTFDHASGWQTSNAAYFRSFLNTLECLPHSTQFRPPYGRITRSQAQAIGRRAEVVMWDVLSWDWDPKKSPSDCLSILKKQTKPGSILVFHDSIKAAPRMLPTLPKFLTWLAENQMEVALLPQKKGASVTV